MWKIRTNARSYITRDVVSSQPLRLSFEAVLGNVKKVRQSHIHYLNLELDVFGGEVAPTLRLAIIHNKIIS